MDDCMSVSSEESRSDDCSDDNSDDSSSSDSMTDGENESEHVVDDDNHWTWPELDLEEALPRLRSNDGALTHLSLGSKGISAEGARELADALEENNSLTHLQLGYNEIGAEGARALAEVLKENDSLQHLDLEYNEIGAEGARALGEGLKENDALARLDLGSNEIGAEGARALAEGLKENKILARLELKNNKIGDEGARALAEVLKENKSLAHLGLGWNKIGAEGARALGEGLKENDALAHLALGRNEIGDEGARALAEGLKENDALAHLDLGANEIGAEGARALGEGLKENNALAHLQLDYNRIGAEGARALGEGLKENDALVHLYLGNNEIGVEGARALGEGLKENKTLAQLDLERNEIGDEGVRALAEGLKENDALAQLDLERNEIGDEGVRALPEVLKENKSLAHLGLGRNEIGDEGARAIAEGLKESPNTTLTYLDLDNNGIGLEGAPAEGYIGGWISRNKLLQLHGEGVQKEGFSFYFRENGNGSSVCIEETFWKAATTGDGHVLGLVQEVLKTYLDGCSEDSLKSKKELLKNLFGNSRSTGGTPLLHLAADLESKGALTLCQFLVEEIGMDFDVTTDKAGRTARDIAQGNANAETSKWAKSVGTFLGRYFIEDYGKYKSATCTVHFAVDVEKPKGDPDRNVALKIMKKPEQFERELNIKLREDFPRAGSGVDIKEGWNRFNKDHSVPLLRYNATPFKGELHLCLVMPKGERNLDEIIRYEGIAGRDINAITFYAVDMAKGLLHMHFDHEIIHGDPKPRNVIRIQGDLKFIDNDASVKIGSVLTDKTSLGFTAPEVANTILRPKDTLEVLYATVEDLQNQKNQAIERDNDDELFEIMGKLKRIKEKISRIESLGSSEKPRANAQMDIWSYGVMMYQLLTKGKSLFDCDADDNLLDDNQQRKLLNWKGITNDDLSHVLVECQDQELVESAKELLRKCLSTKETRPKSFHQVLALPFLKRENLQLRKVMVAQQDIKHGQQDIKLSLEKKLDGLEGKFDDALVALSELQDHLKIVSKTVSNILCNSDAPKLLLVVPEGSSWRDWNLNSLVGDKVKVIFICPVSLSVPRDGQNKLMGYSMTMPHDWAKKYGPALKISLDVLKVAFAVARLTTGLPLPNVKSVGKSTNIFKVINDSVVSSMGKDEKGKSRAPNLKELEKALEDKLTLTVSDESISKAARETLETKKEIEASYKEVKMIAQANNDPEFFKTGLKKVVCEKDGSADYVLDDPSIFSIYKLIGQDCTTLTPKERIEYGVDIDGIAKEGWLRKESRNKLTTNKWRKVYCVLRKNGLLTYYESKEERDKDPLGLKGKTKSNKVKTFSYGDDGGNRLGKAETDDGIFYIVYHDESGGSSQKFGGMKDEKFSPKEVASTWVLKAQRIFNTMYYLP